MKELLKFIGPSFFSDKIAKQASSRGLGSVLLAVFLAAVVLLFGLMAAYTLTFKANYNNTPELVATVERALSGDGAALEVRDGILYSDRIVDTVACDEDRQAYSLGYDIVVDTRDVDTFDDFYAYCVSDSGKEISYEEYLEKDDDVKSLYTFAIKYSGKERVIDDEWIQKCESYLDAVTDVNTVNAYADVKKKSGDEYATALYNLYVRAYYPSLTAYETDGNAPRTRNYYYRNYGDHEKILFVFCDSMIGLYVTNAGAKNTFYGIYTKLSDGAVGTTAAAAKDFIYASYSGATAVTVYSAVMGFFGAAPFMVLVVLAVSVALLCLSKLMHCDELKFGAAAKTVCSFLTVAALLTALATFALGFAVSQNLLAWLEGVTLFAVLAVRVTVMLIRERIEHKREAKSVSCEEAVEDKAEESGK